MPTWVNLGQLEPKKATDVLVCARVPDCVFVHVRSPVYVCMLACIDECVLVGSAPTRQSVCVVRVEFPRSCLRAFVRENLPYDITGPSLASRSCHPYDANAIQNIN